MPRTDQSGKPYKPGPRAEITRALNKRVKPEFGSQYLAELTLPHIQLWADALAGEGLAPQTVANIINSLRSLYGWALPRGHARINPTRGLRLPKGEQPRDRIASPQEAAMQVQAMPDKLKAFMGLAVYAGLRLGEILALDWEMINLPGATISVERAWDYTANEFVTPKSDAGVRTIPVAARLVTLLENHRVLTNHRAGLLFPGRDPDIPIHPTTVREAAAKAVQKANLAPLGFHEARHTAASIFIAAGLNAKTVSTYLGHASISITFDCYGHLFPGNESEARGLLDAYLALQRSHQRSHGLTRPKHFAGLSRASGRSSKLAGPGNPRLGRFDSFAASWLEIPA